MNTQNSKLYLKDRYLLLAASLTGLAVGIAQVKRPFYLAAGIMAAITFLMAPEVLGFFIGGGLYLTGRTLSLGHEELYVLNIGSFLFPLYCLLVFMLLYKKVCAFTAVLRYWEFWAVLGLGLLMMARLPDSLFVEYGVQKTKYYLVNNIVVFFGPVLASAVWGKPGLYRFLRGVFLGGLALTAYFWLSKSYLDLPFNIYAVLNFNPIELSRLIGLFVLLAVFGRLIPFPSPVMFSLAAAAGAAMVLLNARGPALALVIALLFWGSGAVRRKFRLLPILAVPMFLLLAVYISSNYWFSPGFFSMEDTGRLQLYQAALASLAQNPALGAGTGSYAYFSPVPEIYYPHNLFLESAVELGFPGLALSLLLVLAPLSRLMFGKKRVKDAAMAGALLTFCFVNAMISGDIPGNFLLWLSAGVTASLAMVSAEDIQ